MLLDAIDEMERQRDKLIRGVRESGFIPCGVCGLVMRPLPGWTGQGSMPGRCPDCGNETLSSLPVSR